MNFNLLCVGKLFFLWVSVWILSLWMQHKLHNIANDVEKMPRKHARESFMWRLCELYLSVQFFFSFSGGVECRRCSACHARLNAKNQNKHLHLQCRRLMMMAHFMSERECPIHLHIFLYILSLVCRDVKYINYIVIHSAWHREHMNQWTSRENLWS